MTRHFDAVILGAGPAGAAAAYNLAQNSASVLIVEGKAVPEFKIGETVPGIAGGQFVRAGFGEILETVPRLRSSGNRSAWGSDRLQVRSSMLDPYGGSSHIDRLKFDEALLARAVGAGAELLRGTRPRAWVRRHGGWQIALPPPKGAIHCDAIIDCTGRPAVFARSQGARRIAIDKQIALIALLSASTDPDLSITIEAAEFGWWYSAQLPGGTRIVVLFSDIDLLSDFDVRSLGGVTRLIAATRHISAHPNPLT
jgi:flavin-dependent dehydrogenase